MTVWLLNKFGENRIIDTPVSESAITGIAAWASILWKKSVVVIPRMDFMLYAMNSIANESANWNYLSWWNSNCALTIVTFIEKSWWLWAKHLQSLQALFAHFPWLKVVVPSNITDIKKTLEFSIHEQNPVIYIIDKSVDITHNIYNLKKTQQAIWKANIIKKWKDISIITYWSLVKESFVASKRLSEIWISCEIIDITYLKPIDADTILKSVSKTWKALIVEDVQAFCSISSEIMAQIIEKTSKNNLIVKRLNLPNYPVPSNEILEKQYFIDADRIYNWVYEFFK